MHSHWEKQDMTGWNQLKPRWHRAHSSRWPLDHYISLVVLKKPLPLMSWQFWGWSQKAKKWPVAQLLQVPPFTLEQQEYSSHSLAYELTQPIKTNNLIPQGTLAFWEGPYSVYGVCISMNKPVLTLLQLTLQFFPTQNQGPLTWWPIPRTWACPRKWHFLLLHHYIQNRFCS